MLKEPQGVRSELPELDLDPRIGFRPWCRATPGLTLVPDLLGQFLDEGVPVIGLAEAMTAHSEHSKLDSGSGEWALFRRK
jgi:hypothetical protein